MSDNLRKDFLPDPSATATLYYLPQRGRADQVRWLMAATEVSFVQKDVASNDTFKSMQEMLPFGSIPFLQIDGLEIAETQAMLRYLARRGNLYGQSPADAVKCDMIAEVIRDIVEKLIYIPFHKNLEGEAEKLEASLKAVKDLWNSKGPRFEAMLEANGGNVMVGSSTTYADILMAHVVSWVIDELGPEIAQSMPSLVGLQNRVMSMDSIKAFLEGPQRFDTWRPNLRANTTETLFGMSL